MLELEKTKTSISSFSKTIALNIKKIFEDFFFSNLDNMIKLIALILNKYIYNIEIWGRRYYDDDAFEWNHSFNL